MQVLCVDGNLFMEYKVKDCEHKLIKFVGEWKKIKILLFTLLF